MKRTAILVLTVAALVLTVGAFLGVAGPGGAVAHTAAQDQYSAAQDQYLAAPDPYSAALDPYSDGGAAAPPVPSATQQMAQYLQQLLTTQQTAAYLEQLLAAAAPPTGQPGVAAGIAPGSGGTEAIMRTHELGCTMSGSLGAVPDSLNDADFTGNNASMGMMAPGDVADSCQHLSGGTPTTLPFEAP
jgi:hypothetical protein